MSKDFSEISTPCIMGILNVTPDSFSDGGLFEDKHAAIAHMHRMVSEGAQIIDIGGESTRPQAVPMTWEMEWQRISSVVQVAVQEDICVSVDTYHLETAKMALESGINIINDVCAMWHLVDILHLTKHFGAALVVTHNSRNDANFAKCDDPIEAIISKFDEVLESARNNNFPEDRLILDPGIGFGKTQEQNIEIFRNLDRLCARFSSPVLCAVSKKSFFKTALGHNDEKTLSIATVAATVYALRCGCKLFRVHDVLENDIAMKLCYHE